MNAVDASALLVLCTAPDEAVALRLARGLVEAKLAACVNVLPAMRSIYVWKGDLQDEREFQLVIKTASACKDALSKFIQENHPYEVPELLCLAVSDGSPEYLAWLFSETRPS